MPSGTGRTCRTCNGTGTVRIGDTAFTCPPCLGTGEEPGTVTKAVQRRAMPFICAICRRPYHGDRRFVAGLDNCGDDKCIDRAEGLY